MTELSVEELVELVFPDVEAKKLKAIDFVILKVVARHLPYPKAKQYILNPTIARESGIVTSTFYARRKHLEGYLCWEPGPKQGVGKDSCNNYYLGPKVVSFLQNAPEDSVAVPSPISGEGGVQKSDTPTVSILSGTLDKTKNNYSNTTVVFSVQKSDTPSSQGLGLPDPLYDVDTEASSFGSHGRLRDKATPVAKKILLLH